MKKQKELIVTASDRYIENIDTHFKDITKFKTRQIGYWINKHSQFLNKECNSPQRNFKYYKQGSIIRVDFGVNVGYELSGRHFAIVMSRKDSKNDGLLSVVPLTSQNKPRLIPLEYELINKIIEKLNEHAKRIDREISTIRVIHNSVSAVDFSKDDVDDYDAFKLLLDFLDYHLSYEEISENVRIDFEENNLEFEQVTQRNMEPVLDLYKDKIETLKRERNNLIDCIEMYNKYAKQSYVNVEQITTISKERIVPRINPKDPIGSITVSSDLLRTIRHELRRNI